MGALLHRGLQSGERPAHLEEDGFSIPPTPPPLTFLSAPVGTMRQRDGLSPEPQITPPGLQAAEAPAGDLQGGDPEAQSWRGGGGGGQGDRRSLKPYQRKAGELISDEVIWSKKDDPE